MTEYVSRGAMLMGLPHAGARYSGGFYRGRRRYERTAPACAVCDCARSESTHHVVAVGTGGNQSCRTLEVDREFCRAYDEAFGCRPTKIRDSFELLTPLFALCGDGARGCHGLFEAHVYEAGWEWADADCRDLWESGWFLTHGYEPHDERLFEFGRYLVLRGGETAAVISHG